MSKRRSALLFALAIVASLALAHGPLLGYRTYANVDEAYASALASRLLDGFKLYDGAISQRGPLMYESFALFARLFGWDDIVALRVAALLLALAHVALVYVAGRVLLTRTAALIATAITTYALAFGFPAIDGIAINGESLQVPFVIAAVTCGAIAMRRAPGSQKRTRDLFFSGLAWGAAIAIKPQILPQIVPIVIWLGLDARRRKSSARLFRKDLIVALSSTAAIPVLFLAHATLNGTLHSLMYYTLIYNMHVHLASSSVPWLALVSTRLHEEPLFFVASALLVACASSYAVRRVRACIAEKSLWAIGRGFGTRSYLALHFVIACIVATGMQRFFPHYYLIAIPFLSWLAGALAAPLFRAERTARIARSMLVAFSLLTIGAALVECAIRERFDGRVAHDRAVLDVSKYIEKTTARDERIFVWGFSPWIYGYSHRKPAGRFVFSTYVTGFVPWFWDPLDVEKKRIVPGSTEALLGDLEREEPAVVVDAGAVLMARSMRAYDEPSKFLRARYCFEVRIGAYDVYRKKRDGMSCETPFFPELHSAMDALGHPLPIAIAPALDREATRQLPLSHYYDPVTFPGVRLRPDALAAIAHRPNEVIWAEDTDR